MKNPSWWSAKHDGAWERVKDAFARDWEQTKADFSKTKGAELNQGIADTVRQATGGEAIPPRGQPNPPDASKASKKSSDSRGDYESAEPAIRYGFGASRYYTDFSDWDPQLEGKMRSEWSTLHPDRSWESVQPAIRMGWERGREDES